LLWVRDLWRISNASITIYRIIIVVYRNVTHIRTVDIVTSLIILCLLISIPVVTRHSTWMITGRIHAKLSSSLIPHHILYTVAYLSILLFEVLNLHRVVRKLNKVFEKALMILTFIAYPTKLFWVRLIIHLIVNGLGWHLLHPTAGTITHRSIRAISLLMLRRLFFNLQLHSVIQDLFWTTIYILLRVFRDVWRIRDVHLRSWWVALISLHWQYVWVFNDFLRWSFLCYICLVKKLLIHPITELYFIHILL